MTTTNRGLENQAENTLQPGVAFNQLADVLDRQYGSVTVNFAADAALTLTQAQCDHGVLVLTDSGAVLTGAKNVTLTDAFPPKLVVNETAQTLTLLRSVGTGVVLAAGKTALIGCGPDDVVALAGGGGGGSSADPVSALTNIAGTVTVDCSLGKSFAITLAANVTTLTLTNLAGAGYATEIEIEIKQDGTGGHTFALPASFKALGGSDTAIASAANAVTVLSAKTFDNGATWRYAMQESA